MIHIYTDGSARDNGKANSKGGFGVIIIKDNKLVYSYSEQCSNTTNNRMELMAILHAFELARTVYAEETCIIHSDSMYCVNMCNNWIWAWARNNWHNSKNKIVENIDLVKKLYSYLKIEFFNAQVIYCNGHKGILENELADLLATDNKVKFEQLLEANHIVKI